MRASTTAPEVTSPIGVSPVTIGVTALPPPSKFATSTSSPCLRNRPSSTATQIGAMIALTALTAIVSFCGATAAGAAVAGAAAAPAPVAPAPLEPGAVAGAGG